jgi:hypothetical protein
MFIPGPGILYLIVSTPLSPFPFILTLQIILILLAFSMFVPSFPSAADLLTPSPSAIHISSTTLSLPLAPGISLLTILLPVFAAANTLTYPRLLHSARGSLSLLQRIYPTAFQSLQAILTTALATYLLQQAFPGDAQSCHLATSWQRLFAAKDGPAIRRIQDALECCGLNSVRDRAWPFPEGRSGNAGRCVERFDRHIACAGPWGHEAARNAGLELGIVLAVAVLQVCTQFVLTKLQANLMIDRVAAYCPPGEAVAPLVVGTGLACFVP